MSGPCQNNGICQTSNNLCGFVCVCLPSFSIKLFDYRKILYLVPWINHESIFFQRYLSGILFAKIKFYIWDSVKYRNVKISTLFILFLGIYPGLKGEFLGRKALEEKLYLCKYNEVTTHVVQKTSYDVFVRFQRSVQLL